MIETAPAAAAGGGRVFGVLRAARVHGGLGRAENRPRDHAVFAFSQGVGTSRAVHIYGAGGNDTIGHVGDPPLAKDIRGIGFKTANAIAERLGIEKTAMIRIRARNLFALAEAQSEGHCGLRRRMFPHSQEAS